jgi:NADPH:quinone reductase-like Zn-dependent oxidoreductase
MFEHINALIKQKEIKPVLGKIYPIEQIAIAHNDVINNSGTHGRLTLKL